MISARFFKEDDRLHLSMRGHAEHNEKGADVVCAGVSAIVFALAGYLVNFAEDAVIHRLEYGCAELECGLDAEAALKQTLIGLLQISVEYPESVYVFNDIWHFIPVGIK